MMGNIASRANDPDAAAEEVLLWAVLAIYQMADWPGSTVWEGEEAHVARAFSFFDEIGREREAARRLRADVLHRTTRERDPFLEGLLNRSLGEAPGRIAAHERDMASIDARSFKAAALLDPEADFDEELRALTR